MIGALQQSINFKNALVISRRKKRDTNQKNFSINLNLLILYESNSLIATHPLC